MKRIILILSLFSSLTVFGQQPEYPDSGFTNKAEARNLIMNGKEEGKWCEYIAKIFWTYGDVGGVKDSIISPDDTSKFTPHSDSNYYPTYWYYLSVYKDGL